MSRYTKNDDGSIADSKTGLTWLHVTDESKNYKTAEELVGALGDGYRLPTDQELLSIVDRSRYSPAIDTEFFPEIKSDCYWTSTPCAWNPEAAVWVVDFNGGLVSGSRRGYGACVVAVRSSQ